MDVSLKHTLDLVLYLENQQHHIGLKAFYLIQKTLFITYKSNKPWKLIPHLNPNECKNYWNAPDGIYFNKVKNKYKNREVMVFGTANLQHMLELI